MSTRICIIVKVNKENIGKVKTFKKSLIKGLESWGNGEAKDGFFPKITLHGQYIAIYCHWDGYLEGIGKELKDNYNTYEKALNLVLGGSISSIENGNVRYYTMRKGEEWTSIEPVEFNTLRTAKKNGIFSWCEYFYVFDNGEWRYSTWSNKGYRKWSDKKNK